jgi:hypothetical protein
VPAEKSIEWENFKVLDTTHDSETAEETNTCDAANVKEPQLVPEELVTSPADSSLDSSFDYTGPKENSTEGTTAKGTEAGCYGELCVVN